MGIFSFFKRRPTSDAATTGETQETAGKDLRKANTLKFDALRALKMGQMDFALRAFRTSLEEIDDPECRLYLAQALRQVPNLADALTELEVILASYPDYPQALYEAAQVTFGLDRYQEAYDYATRALEHDLQPPTQSELHRIAAQSAHTLGQVADARKHIDQAIALSDDTPQYLLIKLQMLLEAGEWSEATPLVYELMERFPQEERAELYRSAILHHEGDLEGAIQALERVTELDPFNAEGYELRTRLVAEHHGAEAAVVILDEALELLETPTHSLLTLAQEIYQQTGHTERAEQVAELLATIPDESLQETTPKANFSSLYTGGLY